MDVVKGSANTTMHRRYFIPEIALFENEKKYVIYIPVKMCVKTESPLNDEVVKEKKWQYVGFVSNKYIYFMDEGCLCSMNDYLAVHGEGTIVQLVVTGATLLGPHVYPVREEWKYPSILFKAIKDLN